MQHRPYSRGGDYGGGRGGGRGFSSRGGFSSYRGRGSSGGYYPHSGSSGGVHPYSGPSTGGPATAGGPFPRRQLNVSVFFTGVPLNVDKATVREHFESVGHVIDFKMFDPKPGIDYRHGRVEYTDERTAAAAILQLNGTAFGDRAMRVEEVKVRGREFHTAAAGGATGPAFRGGFRGGFHSERRRDGMMFPRGFQDPVLGRGEGIMLEVLKATSTEDAYEAVEQLRVLALERRQDARALLQENPALRTAIIMILQHAGRIPLVGAAVGGASSLPPEAFQGAMAGGGGLSSSSTSTGMAGTTAATAVGTAGLGEHKTGRDGNTGAPSAKRATTEEAKAASKSAAAAAAVGEGGETGTSEAERDEVLQIISAMSEEDVERVLMMTSQDLAQVEDPAQRRQLETLRDRLTEMSSEL